MNFIIWRWTPRSRPSEVLWRKQKSPLSGKIYPQVWIVKHPRARIVCATLGHPTPSAPGLPAYQTLLRNAAKWVAEK